MEYVALGFVIIGVIILLYTILKPKMEYAGDLSEKIENYVENSSSENIENQQKSDFYLKAVEYNIDSDTLRKLFSGKIDKNITSRPERRGNVSIQISKSGIMCQYKSGISFIKYEDIKMAYFEKEYILLELYSKISRVFFILTEFTEKINTFKEEYLLYCKR